MIQKRYFPTFLKKVTPAPKLWLGLGIILSVLFLKNISYSLVVMVISILVVIEEKQFTLFKVILVSMIVLFLSMYGIYGAIAPNIDKTNEEVFVNILNVSYYFSGFAYATKYYMRIAPVMCSMFLLFTSIDTTDLGVIMCQAGFPYRGVFTFIDSFQVITLLGKDMEQIKDAQRARGLKTEGNLIKRFQAFIPIMVPVIANSIVKIQDQAIAMDTKGFNSEGKKTIYRDVIPYKWDPLFKWTGIVLSVLSIVYGILVIAGICKPFLTNII